IDKTAGGSSLPYAATTISSGCSARSVSAASSVRSVAGWYTGMPCSSASDLTGGGSSLWPRPFGRSEEHTSELQSRFDLVCRLLPSTALLPLPLHDALPI